MQICKNGKHHDPLKILEVSPHQKKKKNTKVAIGTSTVHGAPPNAGLANDFARLKAKFVDVVGRKTW